MLHPAFGATGIDPRKVSVLYTGDPFPGITPYLSMREDAFVSVVPVQGSREHYAGITWEDIHKSIRVYMPRTYQDYLDTYDVVILSDTNIRIFTPDQHYWLRDGVLDDGMGLVMVGGLETFAAGFGHISWSGSLTEEILPVTIPTGSPDWVSGNVQLEVVNPDHEFIGSLPYDPVPEYMKIGTDGNLAFLKDGATLLARWISPKFDNPPCYVTWDIGRGRTYAMCHDWTPGGGYWMSRWDYYRDYAVNLMLFMAQRDLPSEYATVHTYRESIHVLAIGRSNLFSLIEFVESFGGNARAIDEEITTLEDTIGEAREHYLDHDFPVALEGAEAALEGMRDVEELAVRIKNEALLWVYVIEWLSVSGVSLFAGVLLWTLMVRRKMYREVVTTRVHTVE
jgi:uncharacterized membrane protein